MSDAKQHGGMSPAEILPQGVLLGAANLVCYIRSKDGHVSAIAIKANPS